MILKRIIRVLNIKTKKANGIKMTGHRIVYKSVLSLARLEVANSLCDRSLACLEVANSLTYPLIMNVVVMCTPKH